MQNRRFPLIVLKCLFLLNAFPVSGAERNILLIVTDDQSPTLGCYGDPVAHSPNVDALAAEGLRFDRAYATTASCSASRSVILSGLHNHANGQYGHTHDYHKFSSFRNVISLSLPLALSREGYRTAQIGKYHVAPEEVYRFDKYIDSDARNPVQMALDAEPFISERSEQPFFLYYATVDPHRGGGVVSEHPLQRKPDRFGNPPPGESYPGVEEVTFRAEDVVVPPFLPDTPEARAELAQYYQSCARVDQGVGRLIAILKEANLFDKTLIVFTSDHGMAFAGGKTTIYEGGLKVPFVVRDPYSENRGRASNALISHTDTTPSLLDFAQGLDHELNRPKKYIDPASHWEGEDHVRKENLGNEVGQSYHGKSWIPVLSDPTRGFRDVGFASHTFHEITMYYPMRGVWDERYKLIWNIAHPLPYPFATDLWASSTWQAQLEKGGDAPYGQMTVHRYVNRPAFELYDRRNTQYEGENLAEDPEFAPILKRYQEKLKELQQQTGDPWILKWEYE